MPSEAPAPFPSTLVPSLIGRFWSSAFRPIHHCGVDITRGLALLFGIGTAALPVWDSKKRWNNLLIGLALERGQSKGPDELTSSIVPRGTSSHRLVEPECSPIAYDRKFSCRHDLPSPADLLPSIQMRGMITASP